MASVKDVIKWVKSGAGTVSLDLEEANALIDELTRLQEINAKLDSNCEVVLRHLQAAHRMLMRHNIPCGSSDYIIEATKESK